MTYRSEICKAMAALADHPDTIFVGQAVEYPGTGMFGTLGSVPMSKRLELPVAEDMQMGMAIGMSLRGYVPICIYPRINFLLLAINQLVLHLDKLPMYGNGWRPKVIIRTMVADDKPMDPGVQHLLDYGYAISNMLSTVTCCRLWNKKHIVPAYEQALKEPGSTLLIERAECYDDD